MPTIDLGQVVGPAGKSAYQYAVDGGYTGTEAEFGALMADAASKTYVDTLFNQLAPVIVTVQYTLGSGNDATTVNRNVKCYPAGTGTLSYSINFSIPRASNPINEITLISPEQYAFTGLYESSGVILENVRGVTEFGRIFGGNILLGVPDYSSDPDAYLGPYTITGSFTLEVA